MSKGRHLLQCSNQIVCLLCAVVLSVANRAEAKVLTMIYALKLKLAAHVTASSWSRQTLTPCQRQLARRTQPFQHRFLLGCNSSRLRRVNLCPKRIHHRHHTNTQRKERQPTCQPPGVPRQLPPQPLRPTTCWVLLKVPKSRPLKSSCSRR